jgi:MoxR-like ATPase
MCYLEKALVQIRGGEAVIAVQGVDSHVLIREFGQSDPSGREPPRPVLAWDATDGFRACSDDAGLDELPEGVDLIDALVFARNYRGAAIFLYDCDPQTIADTDGVARKRLKELYDRSASNPDRLVVVLSSGPLTPSLIGKIPWIGDAPDLATAAEPPRAAVPSGRARWPFGRLAGFDTEEWRARLEAMRPDEVDEIIKADAHREPLERVIELRKTLRARFARKDSIIDGVCAAMLAQVPAVLIGPPGTAKSNIIRCFCEGLGLTSRADDADERAERRHYFEYLLTRYTTPEEIFGPIHVQDLIDRQIYRRVTAGYLPEAQVAFLDEIFKASSAILNTLLTILNDRLFYNAGRAHRVPLIMVFAASNEAPVDEALLALYDRFPLRLNCAAVEDESIGQLLHLSWEQAYDRQFSPGHAAIPQTACTNDFRLLNHVMRISFGGRGLRDSRRLTTFDATAEFIRSFRSLRGDYAISDRTLGLLMAVARAQALLSGKAGITVEELDVFRHVAWDPGGTGDLDRMVGTLKRGARL